VELNSETGGEDLKEAFEQVFLSCHTYLKLCISLQCICAYHLCQGCYVCTCGCSFLSMNDNCAKNVQAIFVKPCTITDYGY